MKIGKRFRRAARHFSPFAAICAVVALGYIGYRTFSLAGPNGIGLVLSSDTQAQQVEIGCSQDIDLEQPTGNTQLPPYSTHYQQFIQRQQAKGDNLVSNFSLEDIDPAYGTPRGYYKITEAPHLSYEFQREPQTNVPFFRVVSNKQVLESELAGGWITGMIPMQRAASYVYSFSYRTTVPVTVSLEYTMPNGSLAYEQVTRLDRQDSWQHFTAYANNIRGAQSFRFVVISRDPGTIDTRDYKVYQVDDAQLSEGLVSITFDDGWQSIADNGIPVLDKYNFRTTQFVISEASQHNISGYMPMDTLRELKKNGHEIASHTLTHCDQTRLSSMDILHNARDSKTALEKEELGPIQSFAYPYGKYDETTQPLVARAYSYMRTSDTGYNDRYFDNRNIRSMVVLNTTTDEEFKAWINYAKTYRLWVIIAYHRVDERGPYSVTGAQLERQMKIIKDSKLKVLPVREAAAKIRP